MPTYEYACTECNHELEAFQKMSDAPLTECPQCHQQSLRKKLSASGFQLKGSGWYATDFKNSGNKPAAAPKSESTVSKSESTASPCSTGTCPAASSKT